MVGMAFKISSSFPRWEQSLAWIAHERKSLLLLLPPWASTRRASTLLFITYNGETEVADVERPEVQRVLESLEGVPTRGA